MGDIKLLLLNGKQKNLTPKYQLGRNPKTTINRIQIQMGLHNQVKTQKRIRLDSQAHKGF